MKLYRISLKSIDKWDKRIHNLYVIESSKENAIDYVNKNKKDKFEIYKVYYLGYELSSYMFAGGKEK
jgi:hypothetical protein